MEFGSRILKREERLSAQMSTPDLGLGLGMGMMRRRTMGLLRSISKG
jgi:hypothetical protein